MNIGSLQQILDEYESGVYNFTKDGKCVECGNCCSAILPVSSSEIKEIKRYVKKNNVKTCKHFLPTPDGEMFDLTCPFLDTTKHEKKCRIYPVRPTICKAFKCDNKPSDIEADKKLSIMKYGVVDMWEIFKEG